MFKEILGKIATTVVEHQPVIATVVLVGSVIATGIVIYKESPKIHKAFEERKEEIKDIKESDKMTEEEKEDEIDKVDKKTAKAVAPSFIKITIGTICVVSSVAFVNFTAAVATGTIATGYNIANEKINAYKDIIKKETPEKAEDIEAMVDRKVAEKMSKYGKVADGDEILESALNNDRVEIVDQFGNGCKKSVYTEWVAAKNYINEYLLDGDDVLVNQFYDKIPGCDKTPMGKLFYFPAYKGMIDIKPQPILDVATGRLIKIVVFYTVSPIIEDKKYIKSAAQKSREEMGTAW